MASAPERAREIFRERGGVLRTGEAVAAGIHPRTLYDLRGLGELQELSRGVYRLREMPLPDEPNLAIIAKRLPRGVICLISALAFHELTAQMPRIIHLALPRTARTPKLEYSPLKFYRFSGDAFSAGIEHHDMNGVTVRIYSAEKTLADCFKFRKRIGRDVALEALRTYCRRAREGRGVATTGPFRGRGRVRRRRRPDWQSLLEHARTCRVERVMRPYLEALI